MLRSSWEKVSSASWTGARVEDVSIPFSEEKKDYQAMSILSVLFQCRNITVEFNESIFSVLRRS